MATEDLSCYLDSLVKSTASVNCRDGIQTEKRLILACGTCYNVVTVIKINEGR